MEDPRLPTPAAPPGRPQESAGQSFVRKIRPVGCIVFLSSFILLLVFCFMPQDASVPGSTAPHDSTYYAESTAHLAELKTELEENLLPKLDHPADCTLEDGVIHIVTDQAGFAPVRAAVLTYYDKTLFTFTTR